MSNPVVFYSKCRPQDADAWPIAMEHKIVFLGYPPWRHEAPDPNMQRGYKEALFDVSAGPACASLLSGMTRGYRAQVSQNANLVAAVTPHSFVIVPRPEAGVCYFAKVAGKFEVVDSPSWGQHYLDLREGKGLANSPAADHIGDVVQCWPVDEWRTVPFPLVPRWITYRLLSRNTAGLIYGLPDLSLEPHRRVEALLSGRDEMAGRTKPTTAALLAEWVSPSVFEHLVVHLLQLEAVSGERWHHVGGSGDGGVDGLAVSSEGRVVGALQCKWHYGGDVRSLGEQLAEKIRPSWPDASVVVAVLLSPNSRPPALPEGIAYLGLEDVASLLEKHADALPMARTLGIHAR